LILPLFIQYCSSSPIRIEEAKELGRIIVLIDSKHIDKTKRAILYSSIQKKLRVKGYQFTEPSCTERSMNRLKLSELGFSREDPERLAELCSADSKLLIHEFGRCHFTLQLSVAKKKPMYTDKKKFTAPCLAYENVSSLSNNLINKLPALKN
jgi:hypothetical protein